MLHPHAVKIEALDLKAAAACKPIFFENLGS
jgi:hypothetical protein